MNGSGTSNGASADAVWDATRVALEDQHPAVADTVLRIAGAHWFDEAMIAALSLTERTPVVHLGGGGSESLPPDLLFVALESLPFVETYSVNRCRLHSRVRAALLSQLLDQDRGFVSEMSAVTASHLNARLELDYDELLELAYHVLATDKEAGAELVDSIFANSNVATAAFLDRLMSYVAELDAYGRLPQALRDRSFLWSAWTAATRGDYHGVSRIAEDAFVQISDSNVADELRLQLAFAVWQTGERERAVELALRLAEQRADTGLGLRALLLLGDLAEVDNDALMRYSEALATFVAEPGPESREAFRLDPQQWDLITVEGSNGSDLDACAEAELDPDTVMVGYSGDDEVTVVAPHSLLAEIWLRIGEIEGRSGRIATASRWLGLAESLFMLLDEADGFQRVQAAQRRLAARHGDVDRLHELIGVHEETLTWSRSTGSTQLELQTLIDLAVALHDLGNLDLAADRYQEAASLADQLGDLGARAAAAQGLAQVAIAEGRFDEADKQLAIAARSFDGVGPDGAQRLELVVGDRWLAANERERARTSYNRVLEWASGRGFTADEAIARLALARAARAALDLDEAERQLQAAAKLSPRLDPMQELEVLSEYTTILRLQHEDEAADKLESRIEKTAAELSLQPTLAWLLHSRASTEARRGELAAAQITYGQALRRFEELDEAQGIFSSLSGLSWVSSELGDDQQALDAARRAEAMAREHHRADWELEALESTGSALIAAGRVDEAIDFFCEAHRRRPKDAHICTNLGWAYLRADEFDHSIKWSRQALKLEPADAFPYRNLGHALLGLGRVNEAKTAYRKAIEGRFGDDHFRNTLTELELLHERHPNLAGFDEMVALFEAEQERLDRALPKRD